MTRLTKAQRLALKRKALIADIPYRTLRRAVQPIFACPGAVCVPWCGMWLAIEPDGYTHS